MSDRASPAHTANGDPIPWCGPLGCSGSEGQVLQHSPNELMGIETKAYLNTHPEIQRDLNAQIRAAFEEVTGIALNCNDAAQ